MPPISPSSWQELADALRDEFAEYGGVLALLEDQKTAIFARDLERLAEANAEIESQVELSGNHRRRREELTADLGAGTGAGAACSVAELIPHCPPQMRGMLQALFDGAMKTVQKIQHRNRRNRVLLARASELNDQLLDALRPTSQTKTYTARGGMRVRYAQAATSSLNLSA